jgi:hypothetical protein
VSKRRVTIGILAAAAAGLATLVGCSYDPATPTPTEEANQRQNLRQVKSSSNMFNTDVGDPEARGQIPPGRR